MKKVIGLASAFFGLVGAVPAECRPFFFVSYAVHNIVLVDIGTVKTLSPGVKSAWVANVSDNTQVAGYSYLLQRIYYRCGSGQMAMKAMEHYDADGTPDVTKSIDTDEKSLQWLDIPPGSVANTTINFVCASTAVKPDPKRVMDISSLSAEADQIRNRLQAAGSAAR